MLHSVSAVQVRVSWEVNICICLHGSELREPLELLTAESLQARFVIRIGPGPSVTTHVRSSQRKDDLGSFRVYVIFVSHA